MSVPDPRAGGAASRAEGARVEASPLDHERSDPTVLDGALYEWPIASAENPFRVVVVEIGRYHAPEHERLFLAVLNALTTGDVRQAGTEKRRRTADLRFDLVTFPEALLPLAALDRVLRQYGTMAPPGFIHVGVRRDTDPENHLLPASEIRAFVDSLIRDGIALEGDVRVFRGWLEDQPDRAMFNLGCVFGADADGILRVALHPKLVRSKFEFSSVESRDMCEADLVSVVVLVPRNAAFQPIYIQPLLCSDALFLPMDRPYCHPVRAISSGNVKFPRRVEHIDIVSIASCTPQSTDRTADDSLREEWHGAFRESAEKMARADEMHRYHGAIVVLANYREVEAFEHAGLSGVFLPHPLREPFPQAFVRQSVFGRVGGNDNRWWEHRELEQHRKEETKIASRGYVLALAPEPGAASLMQLKITRLSRNARGWGSHVELGPPSARDFNLGTEPGTYVPVERGTP